MNRKTTRLIAVAFFLFFINVSFGQNLGINIIAASPQNEFSNNVKNMGFGIGVEGLIYINTGSIPFGVGLNLGFMNYGNENLNVPLSTTLPGVTVNLSRTNNLANFHLFFQLTTNGKSMRPYLDLLFGGNYLYTESKVTDEDQGTDIASSRNISDYAWSYGFGGGLLIKIYEPSRDEMNDLGVLYLDLKARYLKGSEAEYLTEGSIIGHPNGTVTLLPSISKTDLLQIQIGVTAQFNSVSF